MKRTSKYDDIHRNAIKKRSITPETYRGVEFSEGSNVFYVDEYQHKVSATSHVLHFGINTYREELKKELEKHNQSFKKTLKDSEVISVLNKTEKGKQPGEVEQEKCEQLKKYITESSNNLTEIEKYIVNTAIRHLNENNKKTVLVEVLEREADGLIKQSLETHTVVLYKQSDKYLVIDPSNVEFSTILVGAYDNIVACFNKKIQIYKPYNDTGSTTAQSRDCVDIAVKLAFNLNKNNQNVVLKKFSTLESIDPESLKNIQSIEEVSNNAEIYQKLPAELKYFTLRTKQSSDIVEQKKVNAGLKVLHHTYKTIQEKINELGFAYSSELLQKKKSDYFLNIPEKHADTVTNLIDLLTDVKAMTDIGEIKLLGLEIAAIEGSYNE